jgi:DNA-binding HxlR family transcriptional regulator
VARKALPPPRSGCPVCVSLEQVGDRWSLLIVRDLMVRGYRTFGEFQRSGEGISSNVLADRLRKLEQGGILFSEPAAEDGRSVHYRLTAKGIGLAPVMLELLLWAARHERTAAPHGFLEEMENNRETVLAETYRRWQQRDPTPILPPFSASKKSRVKRRSR